ncbi:hypothetical protein DFS33DRAFT_1277409 [Desarmillaria ectypa]|nr:hypothetical protein DFS33DRAFT_1277409 [Desarmillaria ectypa]
MCVRRQDKAKYDSLPIEAGGNLTETCSQLGGDNCERTVAFVLDEDLEVDEPMLSVKTDNIPFSKVSGQRTVPPEKAPGIETCRWVSTGLQDEAALTFVLVVPMEILRTIFTPAAFARYTMERELVYASELTSTRKSGIKFEVENVSSGALQVVVARDGDMIIIVMVDGVVFKESPLSQVDVKDVDKVFEERGTREMFSKGAFGKSDWYTRLHPSRNTRAATTSTIKLGSQLHNAGVRSILFYNDLETYGQVGFDGL